MDTNWLKRVSVISIVILVLSIVYLAGSIAFFLVIGGVVNWQPELAANPYITVRFAIVSFVFSILICAYHLAGLLVRRKRKDDSIEDVKARS